MVSSMKLAWFMLPICNAEKKRREENEHEIPCIRKGIKLRATDEGVPMGWKGLGNAK